jgi:hypothetical protein
MTIPFRQVHLDFHTSPDIPDVAADFDGKAFARTLKEAHVNSVSIFAKCHHGMSYYPTRIGVVHPALKRDLMGEMIEALHAEGIRAPIYVTVAWDEHSALEHQDWLAVTRDGRLVGRPPVGTEDRWRRLCLNTPLADYVAAQTQEILERYPVDGLFFDIVSQPRPGCVCSYCLRGMLAQDLDPENDADLARYSLQVTRSLMDRLSALVRQHQPEATIFFNGRTRLEAAPANGIKPELPYMTHVEIESLPSGHWGYNHYPLYARYFNHLHPEHLGMTGRFHTAWGDFGGVKTQAALEYEVFSMLANGSKCSIGDQMHPRGVLEADVYDRIRNVYASVEAKEPWCEGTTPLAEIAVLLTTSPSAGADPARATAPLLSPTSPAPPTPTTGTDPDHPSPPGLSPTTSSPISSSTVARPAHASTPSIFPAGSAATSPTTGADPNRASDADEGALRMLLELQYQFQFVDHDADFTRYRVLILPDTVTLDPPLAEKVRAYLHAGGKLLVTGRSGLTPTSTAFAPFGGAAPGGVPALGHASPFPASEASTPLESVPLEITTRGGEMSGGGPTVLESAPLEGAMQSGLRPLASAGPAPSSNTFALDELGLDYLGPGEYDPDYIVCGPAISHGIPNLPIVQYGRGNRVRPRAGTEVLAQTIAPYFQRTWRHFCSHRQTPYDRDSGLPAVTRNGNVIYIASPLFTAYRKYAYPVHRDIVGNCLALLLPHRLVKASLPTGGQVTLLQQPGRTVVHLLYYVWQRRSPDLDIIEDIVPLHHVDVNVQTVDPPKQVYLAPERHPLDFTVDSGITHCTVPVVRGHQIVVLEH